MNALLRALCRIGAHSFSVIVVRTIPKFSVDEQAEIVGGFGCSRRGCSAVKVRLRTGSRFA